MKAKTNIKLPLTESEKALKVASRFSVLVFLFYSNLIFCQNDIKTQLQKAFHPIKSIDPTEKNYADLEKFGEAVGNAQIVFLGEQDHGDAPAFLAKTRLIQYLHEKMEFDVLVFENDFWALNKVWDSHSEDSFSFDAIKANTYSVWSACVQAQPLYNYIEETYKANKPLIVSGVDCRHAMPYTKSHFIQALRNFAESQAEWTKDSTSLQSFLSLADELIEKEYNSQFSKAQQTFFIEYLNKVTPSITESFWKQEFINLKGGALNSFSLSSGMVRDVYMAKNLLWLYREKYRGKKIIVWAHSVHIAKNLDKISKKINSSMGNEVAKELKDSIYVLGFSSFEGTSGRITEKKYSVQKPPKSSFESWLGELQADYGFVHFKLMEDNSPFYMKGLNHSTAKAAWTQVFDGVFYIKNMYPCDKTD